MCIGSVFSGYIQSQENLVSKGKYQQMEKTNLPNQSAQQLRVRVSTRLSEKRLPL